MLVLDAARAWGRAQEAEDAQVVLAALADDPGGALAYAQSVIEYEALPYAQRQRVKAKRACAYLKHGMVGKEVTQAQADYLQILGYHGTPPADRAAASALIEQLKAGKGRP